MSVVTVIVLINCCMSKPSFESAVKLSTSSDQPILVSKFKPDVTYFPVFSGVSRDTPPSTCADRLERRDIKAVCATPADER